MRMWMVDTKILCKQHLMGEYREHFAIAGLMRLKRRFDGYIRNNLVEPTAITNRFKSIREEMLSRGYEPKKEFISPDISYLPEEHRNYKVNVQSSLDDLLGRCPECTKRSKTIN
jgi:hypothetical protein